MKIQIFALGGLGENGKNLYVIDVEERLFVFDAGIKYPTRELFGIDEIIPDFRVLIQKKEQIEGIFLSHGHSAHIGALAHILKEINVPVYATNFTMQIVKDNLKEYGLDLNKYNLKIVPENAIVKFGNVRVSLFKTTHSIPESVGFALETLDGTIVYTSNFSFDSVADPLYQTDFQKLNEIADKGVMLLMVESLGSQLVLDGSKRKAFEHLVHKAIYNATDRVIISLYSNDLKKIQKIIDISLKFDKKVAVIGRKAQKIIDVAILNNYLTIPKERLIYLNKIDENNKNDDPDLVCLVTGDRSQPFYMLQKMIKKSDQFIHINETDTIIVATAPYSETEKIAAKTINLLYRSNAKVTIINKEFLADNNATSNEIKMIVNMLNPKYIMPVIGEYSKMYQVLNISKELGYDEKEVFLLDNGDVLRFDDKRPLIQKGRYRNGDVLIDGVGLGDINDIVLNDRELLSADGVLICIAHVDPVNKVILNGIEIITKGFLTETDMKSINDEIKEIFINKITNHLDSNNYVNWNELKYTLRDEINKFLYKELRRRPITIPVLIAVEENDNN